MIAGDGPTRTHADTPPLQSWHDVSASPDSRARALLAVLTLAEKVAQLGSSWGVGGSADGGGQAGADVAPVPDAISFTRAREVDGFPDGLGQLTRVFGTEPVSAAEGMARVRARQREVLDSGRLAIPALVHEECLTGFTTLGATVYPAPPAWAATFDPDLVAEMAGAIGADLHAVGVHQGLAPLMDVVRDYRWGRVEETLGEDPYLVATIGTAYVRGLERAGVVATLKHFAGYAASRGARNHAPVSMGPREFADLILEPFEMAVREGGARSVMNSYTDVDGVPCAANAELLTTILRDGWGFTGTVVSDYGAVTFLRTQHRIAATPGEAGALALTAGLDVELPLTDCFGDALVEQVRAGAVTEDLVDRAVLRVLRQKAELGLLDPDWTPIPGERPDSGTPGAPRDLDSPANRAIARRLAEESVVLLANDGTLPLGTGTTGTTDTTDPDPARDTLARDAPARDLPARGAPARIAPARIAVVGPCADDPQTFMGCYSFANHVLPRYPELGIGVEADSLLTALRAELPGVRVEFARGCAVVEPAGGRPDRSGLPAAVAAARAADLCIAVVGDRAGMFGRGSSGEGCDAPDLTLPGVQGELVEQVLGTGTPVVVVVVSGRPYALGAYADGAPGARAAALVQAFMPGEEGGAAIAGILSGRLAPSGRLPLQIPRDPTGGPGTYLAPPLGQASSGISNLDPTPLYPFAHGLGYTTHTYSDLALSSDSCPTDASVDVAVTVTNTGSRAGAEVAQLYLHDVTAQVTRPVRQLAGYCRVQLEPGAAARVVFTVHADRTSFSGVDLRRVVEPGAIEVSVGPSAGDLPLTATYVLTGPPRVLGAERVRTTPVRVEPA